MSQIFDTQPFPVFAHQHVDLGPPEQTLTLHSSSSAVSQG